MTPRMIRTMNNRNINYLNKINPLTNLNNQLAKPTKSPTKSTIKIIVQVCDNQTFNVVETPKIV